MPNRYEREIEEILRNLEQTDPKPGRNQKFGERLRRKPTPPPTIRPRPRSSFAFNFSLVEWLLVIAVGTALIAGGYAYIVGPNSITGVLAIIGIVSLLLVTLSQFIFRSRPPSGGYGNVTKLHQGPLDSFKTRWNLFLLKLRYRRRNTNS